MEEIVSMFLHGYTLVKDLEQNLPNIANQPHVLISSCDEISTVFGNVRDRLRSMAGQDYGHHEAPTAMAVGGGSVSEWLIRSTQAMNMVVHDQHLAHHQRHGFEGIGGQDMGGGNVEVMETDVGQSSIQRTRRR